MNTLRHQMDRDFDFYDFDSLHAAVEDDEADTDAFNLALADEDAPYRLVRVVDYAGSPRAFVACPGCNMAGRRVDEWGGYECENCGYSNLQERPVPPEWLH